MSEVSEISREQILWQRVVQQAITDALGRPNGYNDHVYGPNDKIRAKAWLRGGTDDFNEVCYLAGYDPQFIRECWVGGRIKKIDDD